MFFVEQSRISPPLVFVLEASNALHFLKAVDTANASEHTGKTPAEVGLGL